MLSSGCATMLLHEYIDDKVYPHFTDAYSIIKPDIECKNKKLLMGYFKGITEQNGKQYYNYVIPDIFRGISGYGLEIFIPISPEDKNAIIKKTDKFKINNNPVYVFYDSDETTRYKFKPTRDHFISGCDNDLFKNVSLNYPTIIIVNRLYNYSGALIHLGQKMNIIDPLNIDAHLRERIYTNKQEKEFSFKQFEQTDVNKYSPCELWYWSDTYVSNDYEKLTRLLKKTILTPGYIFSITYDIVTIPFQIFILPFIFGDINMAPV